MCVFLLQKKSAIPRLWRSHSCRTHLQSGRLAEAGALIIAKLNISVKSIKLLAELVSCYRDLASAAAWEVHEVAHEAVTKFSVEGTVSGADVLEKLFLLFQGFFCTGADQHDRGNGSDNVQVADHVSSSAFIHASTAVVRVYHQFVYAELLVDSADHNCLVYRLVVTADKVAVEIGVQVVHILYIWQRIKGENIVYVEGVLWQSQIALKKQLGTVDHGMHKKIFSLWHVAYFIPGKNLVHWQAVAVLHNFLAGSTLFLIYEIADKKVNGLGAFYQFFQGF